ncbi:fused response regulator/phosphatase [Amylibacter sp. SFDW26]|nr:fused response regulator/phosphatase [Amylibacter sp. SFDW26]
MDNGEELAVLVVDDSKLQLKIVSSYLKKWGLNPVQCLSAQEALEHCKNQNFDLIISDWMMPDVNGLEFCKIFKKLNRSSYGYFILLTSKSAKEEIAEGLSSGADDFLSKPVNPDELFGRIQAGQRILKMEQSLQEKNKHISDTLAEVQALNEEIRKDLVAAEKLQLSLIPENHKKLPAGDISILFKSCGHVGGDLVGFFQFSNARLGMYSIDVSGHGISSALVTARLAGYLSRNNKAQNIAFERDNSGRYIQKSPAQIAKALNNQLLADMETEHYFTLAFADIDLETGQVDFVQAGHPHPVIVRSDGTSELVGAGGPPIGLVEGVNYTTETLHLNHGDRLLLYSDGITECQNATDALYDDDNMLATLSNHVDSTGLEYLNTLLWDVSQFANGTPFYDDLSAILFEFSGKNA